ncbi:MAG: multiheme c-type cytochrome [Deltaproteobacteria bacterium]|jgi:hypothetical protein
MRPLLLLVVVGAAGCTKTTSKARSLGYDDAVAFYAAQPRFLQPVAYSEVPEGLPDLEAATCGKCHVEIYEEWKISTHARAWTDDAQFMAELEKSNGQGVGWMCVNCHTPMVNQLPRLVAKLEDGAVEKPIFVDNPRFSEALQKDAITCGTCHVKDGQILGPYGDTIAPHPVKKDPSLLKVDVCTQCHQAKAEWRHIALACVFDTGQEYAASDYDEAGKTCQSCHMPEVTRPIATNGKPRKTRRHWFGGSLIPKHPRFTDELAKLRAHYPPGLEATWVNAPDEVQPTQPLGITYRYANANTGHMLPSGDPERFIRIELEARTDGGPLIRDQFEIGSVYQWSPEVKKLSDNRLKPKEAREGILRFTAPKAGPIYVTLKASRFRINEKNLAYHDLEGKYVAGQHFLTTTATIAVR